MRKIYFLCLLLCLATSCAGNTTVRTSKNYQDIINHQPSALVLPTEARIYEVELSGKQKRLYDFEYNIEHIISQQIIEALNKHGLSAKILTRKEVHDQQLYQDLEKLQEGYLEAEKRIYKDILMPKDLALAIDDNVGEAAKNIAAKNADTNELLLLVSRWREIGV